MSDPHALPMSERDSAHLPGHWLLARLGKRVLRPGGAGMTTRLLADAGIEGSDVVELAPASVGPRGRSWLRRRSRTPASSTTRPPRR